jgi:hypothetical protein
MNLDQKTIMEIREAAYEKAARSDILTARRQWLLLGFLLDEIYDSFGPTPERVSPKNQVSLVFSKISDQPIDLGN